MSTECYQLSVQGLHNGQYVENVMNFSGGNLTANDTFNNSQDLIDSFVGNIQALWLGVLPPSYSLMRYSCRRAITKPSVTRHKQYVPGSQVGSLGTEASTYQTCPTVFLIPPIGTKTGGRIFLPAVPEGQIIGNVYQSTYISAVNDLMVGMLNNFGLASITWEIAIVSRRLNTFETAEDYRLSAIIGFQGNRRKAVGG